MRLVSRPRRIRQIAREGIIKWAKIRAAERKHQRRIEDLRGLRGEAPSASTRHGSTTFEQPPTKSTKSKEPKRRNRGQTQTRSKIGWRVAEAIERMGAISRRIVSRYGSEAREEGGWMTRTPLHGKSYGYSAVYRGGNDSFV